MTERIGLVAANLRAYPRLAVAVSGGIDSLTLATLAVLHHPQVEMFHAISPAVPPEATERVRGLAARDGWRLREIDAGEFGQAAYIANPVNRCYYCKQSLYASIDTIARIAGTTSAQIVSGTNADDLGEYRPGLDAARELGVRHPFVELGVGKDEIRAIARALGLGEIATLPSSPCLSSRIESGIPISAEVLAGVHEAERAVRAIVPHASSVRCRVRASGVVIEIDAASLTTLDPATRDRVIAEVASLVRAPHAGLPVSLAAYRNGSAFLVASLERARA